MKKEHFVSFLKKFDKHNFERNLAKFEAYFEILFEENQKVNMISRKTSHEDYWTTHFLDSILSADKMNFSKKKILDFGTGGGLPGIPIKILCPDCEMFLLDSRLQKSKTLKKMVKVLDLKKCEVICSRIEELPIGKWKNRFDAVISRSVKILPVYKSILFNLIKQKGNIILYKSINLDDTEQFMKKKIFDVSHPEIGTRKIISIRK